MRNIILALALLGGCSQGIRPSDQIPMPANDTCGAAPFGGLIGQDATALETVLIMRMVRVIRPGDAVTKDMRAERINFEISGENLISRIYCG